MKKYSLFIRLLFVLQVYCGVASAQVQEYYLKSAFLEKFTKFSEWPKNAIADHFVITVLGKNPFENALENLKAKVRLKDKPVKVRYISDMRDIGNTQILFIANSEKENVERIVAYTKGMPLLTVGDTPGFSAKGVHFNFYLTDDKKVRFEINLNTIRTTPVTVSQFLLEFGRRQ